MPFSFSPIIILPVRVIQALFALIVLITLAYAANKWSDWTWSPSEINFLIFAAVWTLLALVYLVLAPMRYERYAHKYGMLFSSSRPLDTNNSFALPFSGCVWSGDA